MNGIYLCPESRPTIEIQCDSSLLAGGGHTKGYYYAWLYSKEHRAKYTKICHLEAINLLVAYVTLAPKLQTSPANVIVWTDNMASSYALHTGRTKDPILASCARELWLQAARLNHHVQIKHKSGHLIPLADALSRMFYEKDKKHLVQKLVQAEGLQPLPPVLNDYNFFTRFL